MFVEPVIGAGGLHLPVPGYLQAVAALCERAGALLVVDAVIAAFGRLGTWFAADRFGVRPDMITFAKGVTSGYLPLGGVVISGRVAAPFWERGGLWFRHGQTYSGHPTACAAAHANLDIIEREHLLNRGRELEDEIAAAFGTIAGRRTGRRGARRARGTRGDRLRSRRPWPRTPTCPARTFAHAKARGVLVRPLGDAVAISPPLISTREEIDNAAAVIGESIAGRRRRPRRGHRSLRARAPRGIDCRRVPTALMPPDG